MISLVCFFLNFSPPPFFSSSTTKIPRADNVSVISLSLFLIRSGYVYRLMPRGGVESYFPVGYSVCSVFKFNFLAQTQVTRVNATVSSVTTSSLMSV